MDNVDKVILAICVGKLAGDFLFSTSRVLKAIELFKECLLLLSSKALEKEKSFVQTVYSGISVKIFYAYVRISDLTNGIECGNKLLVLLRANGERDTEGKVTFELATLFLRRSEYAKAKELYEKALCIMKEIRDRHGEATCYGNLGTVFQFCGHYAKAKEHFDKAIAITKEIGDKEEEAGCYTGLGNVFQSVGEYGKAEEYYRKAIPIRQKYGDKEGEATCYGNLGNVFQLLGEYTKAKEYCKKALAIFKEIGDKEREAACYGNLGSVFTSLCEYVKAEECLQKALAIRKKTGDRYGEAADYGNLGRVFKSVAEYTKAKKYLEKALAIKKEIGDKRGEAVSYGGIGVVYGDIGEYNKAKECLHKALRIRKEIGDREGEAADYGNLGVVFKSLGEYVKAREYLEKALAIRTEIGDRFGEATDYEGLGRMCISLGEYVEAEDYLKKALSIRTKIGDKRGEASSYRALGGVYGSLGENAEAAEYHRKALAISIEIGDRAGEASSYISLGNVSESLGEYVKAKEHFDKALAIKTEIGDRSGEALCYESLGSLFQSLGKYVKAKQHHEKALSITKVIGEREREGVSYRNLGTAFLCLGEDAKSKQCYDKALAISKEIGDVETEFQCYINLTLIMMMRGDVREVFSNLIASIQKSESMQHYLRDNDQFKISFLDTHVRPYRTLSSLYCSIGNPYQALHVVELGRARALVDLMLAKYFSGRQMSVNPQSWVDIERVMNKERNCSCLYISYMYSEIFLWILKADKPILLRQIDVNERSYTERSVRDLDDFFGKEPFCRKFYVLPQGHCEDRSLGPLDVSHATRQSQEESVAAVRLVEEEDVQELKPSPRLYYKLLIAPVADLLDEPEIIIVPDRYLYKVPFAALEGENGMYLSETFRIRIVPSLTTLKLIQDRPADQYSETDPLIVGDPDVSLKTNLSELPFARKEAEMVGRLLGVRPLIGYEATKLAVLEMIHSASLIHIAAHGDAERGEIALAPVRPVNRILQQGDFVLTMPDVAQVQLQAKLVVLSCCHSGRGQIRAEGVVGIARAFLGSGARSVLVSLWALEDKATEQFMGRFYEHLVRGESASESLHQTMKWMRGNGYSDVRQWAPFMLIGDNVTFNFGK